MESPAKPVVRTLQDSVVLITGGTSGVGLASAKRFAEVGVRKIMIVGRDLGRGDDARKAVRGRQSGVDVQFISADVNRSAEALRVVEATVREFGRIDVLLNSTVGPYGPTLLHKLPIEDIEPILLTQTMGPLLMSRAALPSMRENGGGVILNIASDAAKLATPGESVIGAAMAAIVMFTRTLAIEAKRNGIRVNALTPSLIEGTMTNARMMADPFAGKLFEKARQAASLGVCVADDLADTIVFLASPQAARITGQAISVNGGISAA